MLLHVRTNAVGIAEETQVAKLIDLVRSDALLAQELLVPGKVFRRATEEAHTGAAKVILDVDANTSGRLGCPASAAIERMS